MKRWLDALGLGEHAAAFAEHAIDGEVLPHLSEVDLETIGIPLGHRKKIIAAIAAQPMPAAAPAARPDAERRQVTVLFCDMVGSTALSERFDPEDLRDVMRAYQDACAGAIARYDGHIAQTLGDGLMVYFGYPQAHEDDAARAVRAGIDIVEAVRGLDAGLPVDVAVRVGIHTGLVVAGEVGGADTRAADAIVGETPNIAARVQGMAKPNTVFVSEATHGLTAGAFTWDDLGTKKAKGVTGGIHVYKPTGATEAESRFEAHTAKGMTPLVGREEEIGLLMGRWGHAKEGEGQVASGASVGRSRHRQVAGDTSAARAHRR
jgi:class 3 adenylate cyclase